MNTLLKLLLVLLCSFIVLAQAAESWSPAELKREISKLNDQHAYEKSIVLLEDILNNPKATAYERAHAYLQKSLTYKRLYNYAVALKNLDLALAESKRTGKQFEEMESLVMMQRMFIYFDLQRYEEFEELFKQIDERRLRYVDTETKAVYTSTLGILAMNKKAYAQADTYLDQAIALLLLDNPKHLPNVYRVKVLLYGEQGAMDKAMAAFNKGLNYADQYKMDIYRIIMYETMTKLYKDRGDYKNAFAYQMQVSDARTKYNANNVSGTLTELEKDLLFNRKAQEVGKEKQQKIYLSIISVILLLLLGTFARLLVVSRQKRELMEKENSYIRQEVEVLTHELSQLGPSKIDLKTFSLTSRQLDIIRLVQEGKTNKQIGELLFISENTVKYHLKQIYETLGVVSRTELRSQCTSCLNV